MSSWTLPEFREVFQQVKAETGRLDILKKEIKSLMMERCIKR